MKVLYKTYLALMITVPVIFSSIGLADPNRVNGSTSNISQECLDNPMFGHYFRQTRYSTSSHQEDLVLASLGNRYAETLLDQLSLRDLQPEKRREQERWIRENCAPFDKGVTFGSKDLETMGEYLTPERSEEVQRCRYEQDEKKFERLDCEVGKIVRKSPVQVKPYIEKFQNVIEEYEQDNNKMVYKSRPHEWDHKNKKDLIKKFPAAAVMPKLLATLAMGATSRFMATEQDQELRSWILDQPISSILPEDIFRESLRLQNGDIYKALLSVENVLSEFWLVPNRQHLKQTAALRSITNYCPGTKMTDGDYGESRETLNSEDVFGSWYHLFGTMLLGCVEGPVLSTIVGKTESLGGRVLDIKNAKAQGHNLAYHMIVGTDPQEEKINARGGRIGHGICKNVPRNYYKNKEIENPKVIQLDGLFKKNKKFFGRMNQCDPEKDCYICDTKKCMDKKIN